MFRNHYFIRNIEADNYLENFLVSAVASILLLRFYLQVTGFPQIGGEGLHIAHMLWGGFIMLIAVVLLLTFLNRTTDKLASVLGGIGFGVFIDELGKFITQDNNYFFEPTVAILYVIFVLFYLSTRAIPKVRAYSQKEYLINTIEMLKDAVVNDLDHDEKKIAEEYLSHADAKDDTVKALKKLFKDIESIPSPRPNWHTRFIRQLREIYHSLTRSKTFITILFIFIILQAVLSITFLFSFYWLSLYRLFSLQLSISEWGVLIASVATALMVFSGLIHFRINRLRSYLFFRTGILINIFLTQFFLFYSYQFYALLGLIINLSLLLSLNYMIERNREEALLVNK